MGDNVVTLPGVRREVNDGVHVEPEKVLQGAMNAGLRDVIVIGIDHKGERYYAASDGNYDATIGKLFRMGHWLAEGAYTEGDTDG